MDGLTDPSERNAERYRSRPAKPWQLALARTGLWTTVVLGCLTGVFALVRSGADDPAPIATDSGADDLPAPVGNVAELAVTSWLTATDDENHMEEFFVDPPRLADMATSNLQVGDVRAVAGQELGDGYWTVTVAARVTDVAPEAPAEEDEADEEDEPVAQTWYIEVGIVGEIANGLAAIATPAIMPAPPPVSDEWRRTGEDATTPDAGDPIVEAVQGFLEAVLTGSGDPSRYTAPGLEIEALDPPPFTDVRVVEMALEDLDGGEVSAWVQAQVTTESGAHQVVAYEFVAVPRVDRWEIVEFWGSPSEIEGPEPAPPPEATDDTSPDAVSTDGEDGEGDGDDTSSDDTTGTTASDDGSDGTSSDTTAGDAPDDTSGTTGPDATGSGGSELSPEEMPDEGGPGVST